MSAGRTFLAEMQAVFPLRPSDLLPGQAKALRALRGRAAVRVGSLWRLRGAPAPRLNAFALSTLLEMDLVRLAGSGDDELRLTPAGNRLADELADNALPLWLASVAA
jgi:hypothetical protein